MRWLIRVVVSIVVLAGLLVGALFLLPADKIAALATGQIRAATGRDVSLSGRLRPSLYPQIGVATGPVSLTNAPWSDQGPMLQAEGLSVGLDLRALIGGVIKVREVTLKAPKVVLERAADGAVNWKFGSGSGSGAGGGGAQQGGSASTGMTIDTATISDGTLVFIDHAAGIRQELSGVDATLTLPDFAGPASVTLAGRANGQPVSAEVTVGAFGPFLSGAVAPVTAVLTAGGARVAFDGRAGNAPLAAEGRLDADVGDLAAVFAALGQPVPDLPQGIGRKIALAGQVTYAPDGALHLRDGTLTLGDNRLAGSADLTLAGKPRLTGQFSAGALDLSPFTTGGGAGGGGGAASGGGGGWSTDPIDVSALGALDAEVAISADSVDLGQAQLGRTRVLATLNDRRLVLDLRELRAYDGLITGNVVLNGRGGLSVGGDLTIAGVAMQGLLGDMADYRRLIGRADLSLKFLGSGASMDAIMKSLSGSGKVALGKGELQGLDLAGMLRTLDTSYVGAGAKTIFDSISASFSIDKGVLRNDDLAFAAPLLTAGGKGSVGLGARVLDYRVTPVALPGADGGGGVKVPLMITGSWAKPKFQLDLEALAKEKLDLDAKKAALEEKARANAAKELGAAEGESLEDAAKRKLEEEAKKGLLKLLGGN